ncbi:DUF485 domain-containing protein [Streptomyces sp. NPDC046203]|uniref:DUF485 domain-containing protein n=1 Tax=Streptomyces sp. NPDC046203 TaxID=3154602 RepID=UPI0033C3F4A1
MEKQDGRDAATVRIDDPWYDALAAPWGEPDGKTPDSEGHGGDGYGAAAFAGRAHDDTEHDGIGAGVLDPSGRVPRQRVHSTADIYLEVQRSPAFQEVRSRYRRFVFPATVAFLLWYLAYVIAATAAPGVMAHPVAGAVNVAMLAGLGQFASTFLLTWAYVRNARRRRDQAALELRWDTQQMTRGARS